jgi:hypothetical protein
LIRIATARTDAAQADTELSAWLRRAYDLRKR